MTEAVIQARWSDRMGSILSCFDYRSFKSANKYVAAVPQFNSSDMYYSETYEGPF